MYLLDSNACIRLMNESSSNIIKHMQQHPPAEIGLCSIIKAELLYGACHSQRMKANLQLLQRFFKPLTSLTFDDRCAEEAGLIHADLAAQGKPIGPNDVLIAATARSYDVVLITHNTGEFSRVTGLRLEDWEIE